MEDQWDNLRVLAEAASLMSEEEDKIKNQKKKKKRNPDFSITRIPKKRRTVATRRPSFSTSSSEESNTSVSSARNKDIPAALRERVVRGLGGDEPRLVVEKALSRTDVSPSHGRLSIPSKSLIAERFLNKDEETRAKEKAGMEVLVVDETLREYNLRLKQWRMGRRDICNLTTAWNSVVKDNALSADHRVQLWSFRGPSQLCFAFVNINVNIK